MNKFYESQMTDFINETMDIHLGPEREMLIEDYRSYGEVAAEAVDSMKNLDPEWIKDIWSIGGAHSAAAAAVAVFMYPSQCDRFTEAMFQSVAPIVTTLNSNGLHIGDEATLTICSESTEHIFGEMLLEPTLYPSQEAVRIEKNGLRESIGVAAHLAKQALISNASIADYRKESAEEAISCLRFADLTPAERAEGAHRLKAICPSEVTNVESLSDNHRQLIWKALGSPSERLHSTTIAYYTAWYQALYTHLSREELSDTERLPSWPTRDGAKWKLLPSISEAA